ncbi:MAG: hypothetical protein KDB90_13125 [Planctomycetes bacterium]|nr:hypothetical protein [Planctomycetota bacterium]
MKLRLSIAVLALATLPLFVTNSGAQDAPERQVEVRLLALSRGYLRPMSETAQRIQAVEGIQGVKMLGFSGDMARYELTTKLDDKALADALELKLVGSSDGVVTLAAEMSSRAKHAEARGILTQIARAVMAQPKPTWRGNSEPLFGPKDTLKQRLERLGLNMDLLKGTTYKPDQFHVEEQWQGSGGTYKIWAGDQWEGIYVPSSDWYLDTSDEENPTKAPEAGSNFVGIRVYRSPYSNSMSWVDMEGLLLTGFEGQRDDTNAAGELYVKLGADWITTILKAVAAKRIKEPKLKMDRLPRGRGWEILQAFNYDDSLQMDVRHYNMEDFELSWRDNDSHLIATLRAHHPAHPFYLEAELDTTDVVDTYKKLADNKDPAADNVENPVLGAALTWVVAAEQSVEVFEKRRAEASATFEKVCEGIRKLEPGYDLDSLIGNLDSAERQKALGLSLEAGNYAPGDYSIHRQLLGDLEISVGGVRTGGRQWVLINARTGEIIRSNQ